MKNRHSIFRLFLLLLVCISSPISTSLAATSQIPKSKPLKKVAYMSLYDPIANKGQYWHPEMKVKPKQFWSLTNAIEGLSANKLGEESKEGGLQYNLLAQSIAGLANRAVQQSKSEIAVWLDYPRNNESYARSKQALLNMGISEQGRQTGIELACNSYSPNNGVNTNIRNLFDGYVLTDVENNPESNIVASIASHVYNAIIVDVRDQDYFQAAGYTLQYDARSKTTKDAWAEFKDRCNNKALVVMPVKTAELREFAIANNLFVLNLNKEYNTPKAGQNVELFKEILAWLAPNSPVYGWEQGVGEDQFVNLVSKSGNMMVPCDWSYNHSLTGLLYKKRQTPSLAKVINPKDIDYTQKKKYVSFFLTDGDNIQWMMNGFVNQYLQTNYTASTKISFGIPVSNLAMMAPAQFDYIMSLQPPSSTYIETLGGGYYYPDNFAGSKNRKAGLAKIAADLAAHMRQHRIKIAGVMCHDVTSPSAQESYQAYIDANDQLEGIVSTQYSPYAGGGGQIFWFKNKKGYSIPVVTVDYSIWNQDQSESRQGSPTAIANYIKEKPSKEAFSVVAIHAWSGFSDIGTQNDSQAEKKRPHTRNGAGAADLCMRRFDNTIDVVNTQELIWRIRMKYKPEETKKYLNEIY